MNMFKFTYLVVIFASLPLFLQGQVTQDQLKQMRSSEIRQVDGVDYYIHTIRRGQTLYMISKIYSVEVNDIIAANPEVKEGIKADQKIRIPVTGQKKEPTVKKAVNGKTPVPPVKEEPKVVPVKPVPENADTVAEVLLPCGSDTTVRSKLYRVALMLPLYLGEVAGLNAENPVRRTVDESRPLQFIPFYEGFRMALDSLERNGLKVKLYVYDVDKDTAKTRQVLRKPELKSVNLIIGLLYHRNFQMVAEFAKKNRIPIVNPVSERSDIFTTNPYVFKVMPARKAQFDQLAGYMQREFNDGQIIIVRSGQYGDREAPERLRKECQERKMNALMAEGQEVAIGKLKKDTMNYVIAFSDNAAYTLDLTRRFFELRNDYLITMVGLPDWGSMEGLEMEYLIALRTHLMTKQFVDYREPATNRFVLQYQETYRTDPPKLAFQGFDVAMYFLTALREYGTGFTRCIDSLKVSLMQTRFEFLRSKTGGFENQHWPIYRYENYRLVPLNRKTWYEINR